MKSGTAKWVRPFLPYPIAGKTGTSNDERDSWFIGFTPQYLTSVWVGYDDNTPHQLTGASGALLIWFYFMKSLNLTSNADFDWPNTVEKKLISPFHGKPIDVQNLTPHPSQKEKQQTRDHQKIELIFEAKSLKRWYQQLFN